MTTIFDKETLKDMLLNKNYSFPNSPFEPSSSEPIGKDNLTNEKLAYYLDETYLIGDRLYDHKTKIEEIIGEDRAQYLISLNKSEYLKVLAHFSILSRVKKGWDNLLITNIKGDSKPSLSNNPISAGTKDSKKFNDAVILCFYSRLLEGMTEQDKEIYKVLLPVQSFTSGFDSVIDLLDAAIQDLFSFEKQNLDGYYVDGCDESLLPDSNLDEAIENTRNALNSIKKLTKNDSYKADSLRATLIKCASINRAINDIEAIFNIQNEILHSLPKEMHPLLHVKSESEILPAISNMFNEQITKLPHDLIECSILVCVMYIAASLPPKRKEEFKERHLMPDCIAVSAALLYQDSLDEKKISLNIRGEKNNSINVYKSLSDFVKKISTSELINVQILSEHGFPEELFKYLTTRYSLSVFGLSEYYPSQIGSEAHFKVRRKKWELQKEVYESLKDMSINEADLWIKDVCFHVLEVINH